MRSVGENRLRLSKCQGPEPAWDAAMTRNDAGSAGFGPRPARFERKRKGSLEKNGRNFLHALPDCLFPRKQGVTGMNPTAFPASLTGRIWFFVELRTTTASSDCSRPTDPSSSHPLEVLAADSFGVSGLGTSPR